MSPLSLRCSSLLTVMKIVSDVGDPHALVTNAEVLSFLKDRNSGSAGDAKFAGLVKRYVIESPASSQTVESIVRLREALAPFKLLEEEFVRICNLRADSDVLLERVLAPVTLQRLSDDDWEQIKTIIDSTLEARAGDNEVVTGVASAGNGRSS